MSKLANKLPLMEGGKDYIILEVYNEDGSISEKMIGLEEAAEILNNLSSLYLNASIDLDEALSELQFWKDMYSGYFSTLN